MLGLVGTLVPLTPAINGITRVGQNRIYTPYMTIYLMISLPKIPYIHRIYMVLASPRHNSGLVAPTAAARAMSLPYKCLAL
jgi:hypothetical protein